MSLLKSDFYFFLEYCSEEVTNVSGVNLYQSYFQWCERNQVSPRPRQNFYDMLPELNIADIRSSARSKHLYQIPSLKFIIKSANKKLDKIQELKSISPPENRYWAVIRRLRLLIRGAAYDSPSLPLFMRRLADAGVGTSICFNYEKNLPFGIRYYMDGGSFSGSQLDDGWGFMGSYTLPGIRREFKVKYDFFTDNALIKQLETEQNKHWILYYKIRSYPNLQNDPPEGYLSSVPKLKEPFEQKLTLAEL